jgi:hypothetical protein
MSDEPYFDDSDELSSDDAAALRDAPADIIVGNHLYHLLQLATIHLSADDPDLDAASLIIDAAAAMISAVGDRLGEPALLLRQAVSEIQSAYVRAVNEA